MCALLLLPVKMMNLKFQYGAPTRQRSSGVSGPNYTKFWKFVEPSSLHTKFQYGEDILLSFQTTEAQTLLHHILEIMALPLYAPCRGASSYVDPL